MDAREFLMIPGPTPVPSQVLQTLSADPLGHRTKEFSAILADVVSSLKEIAGFKGDAFIFTSSGTGAMEAAIANTINAQDKVLSLVSGVFGERWAKIATAYGANVERIVSKPGQAISVEQVAEVLNADKDKKIKAVTMTHNETSTGVINDLEKLAQLVKAHGAISIVDAVTTFAAAPLPIDKWGLDVVISGSQKALMLPPGLAFIFVSERAWKAYAECKSPRFYFDFERYRKSMQANTTPFTPNVSLIAALQTSLNMMKADGMEAIFARHEKLKRGVRAGVSAMGLKLFADDKCASPTITAIYPPDGIGVDAIRQGMKQRFQIRLADGQDDLKGKIFRIGHMGYVFERDVLTTLASLEAVFADLGYKTGPNAGVQAAIPALR